MSTATIRRDDLSLLEHHNVRINGINLHYVAQGQGPLLLLLHGFPEYWYSWRKQIPVLAQHFRVVAPDLRGYGGTDKPQKVQEVALATIRQDIQELIGALGHEKALLVAHDWGAAVAWDMAIRTPQYIDQLVILNMPHPARLQEELKKNFRQLRRSWYFFYFQLPFIPETLLRWMLPRIVRRTFRGWAYQPDAFTDADLQAYQDNMRQPGAIRSMINYYRAAFRNRKAQMQGLTDPVTVPTRILWGENDKALGKELTYGTERFFEAPVDIHYFPNCSHWVASEYPDRVNELILDFFRPQSDPENNE
ncbi:MAG: alpha/beta hydrolase [Bacteroidota bacterium]